MSDLTESSNSGGPWSAVLAIVVALGVIGAVVGVVVTSTRDDAPSRQDTVAARGAAVMPFDLEATTHTFDATDTGGVQTVVADDPTDNEQIALIRSHLQEEVRRFRRGDFGDPESIHGHDMPGLRTLAAHADSLDITYGELDRGGEVIYTSADPTIVTALHDWFAAQLRDHGPHAQAGEHESS
jgi:hypothetical protein